MNAQLTSMNAAATTNKGSGNNSNSNSESKTKAADSCAMNKIKKIEKKTFEIILEKKLK